MDSYCVGLTPAEGGYPCHSEKPYRKDRRQFQYSSPHGILLFVLVLLLETKRAGDFLLASRVLNA
jgi:hypothetical protein